MRRLLPPLLALIFCGAVVAEESGSRAYQEAFVSYKTGKLEQALHQVDAILAGETPPARVYELKGRILHSMGRHSDAQELLFTALEQDPTLVSVHYHLGEAAFRQGSWGESVEYFQVHLREVPGHRPSMLKIIYCLTASGNLAQATQLIGMLDPMDEFQPHYYFARAAVATVMGRSEESAGLLQQARTLYGNEMYGQFEPDFLYLLRHSPRPVPGGAEE